MADSPQTPIPTSVASPDSHLDRLAHLHRMSRTAGLGASEYSAVNIAAVVAVLVGAASALALVSPVFLFLPVLGVVIAGVAIKQIRSSNGTQTGLPLAILALVLSFGLTAFTGLKAYRIADQERRDNRTLDALIGDFGRLIAENKIDEAYALTDARFQEQVSKSLFAQTFEEFRKAPTVGPLVSIKSNKLFGIDADPETGLRMAMGYVIIDTEKMHGDTAIRTEVRYRNSAEQWRIYAIPQIFPAKAAAPAGGGAASGAAGPPAPR